LVDLLLWIHIIIGDDDDDDSLYRGWLI